jgi:hypothetical protein
MRAAATMVATPMGTLTRNTHCHPAATSRPPSGGPSAAATAPTDAHVPTALARRSAGQALRSNDNEVGVISAAPTPCTVLAATSAHRLGASAQAADATVKIASPMRKTRRWP